MRGGGGGFLKHSGTKSTQDRVGQNCICKPYRTVYLVNSLQKKPCMYTVYNWFWPTLKILVNIVNGTTHS